MLKGIPKVFIGLFFLMFFLALGLVAYLYIKTGDITTIFDLKQVLTSKKESSLRQSEGFLLPDESGHASIGYTSISTDGKHAFVVVKILEISKNGSETTGKASVSADDSLVVEVIFASDITKDTLYIQERKVDDFSPVSADYKTSELKGSQIENRLRKEIGRQVMLAIRVGDSSCNQLFIKSKMAEEGMNVNCKLKVSQVNLKI